MNPVKLTKNLEIPSDVLTSRGLTRRQLEQQQNASTAVQPPQRSRDETADEKRARKQAVREMRKVRKFELWTSNKVLPVSIVPDHNAVKLLGVTLDIAVIIRLIE